jgi:hypothetical protein
MKTKRDLELNKLISFWSILMILIYWAKTNAINRNTQECPQTAIQNCNIKTAHFSFENYEGQPTWE